VEGPASTPVRVEVTDHDRLMREFWNDPAGFVDTMLEEEGRPRIKSGAALWPPALAP
jgi:hypothetical protein